MQGEKEKERGRGRTGKGEEGKTENISKLETPVHQLLHSPLFSAVTIYCDTRCR